jgi:O-succinylbenzoic acid--CoA ligase
MLDLVAIDLAGGTAFVDELRRAWDDGDAAFPVDQRLPREAKVALVDALAATVVVDATGRHRRDGRDIEPGDALVVATSGSTGRPKGVVLTHDALEAAARAGNARLEATAVDTWLACLPLSHVGGLGVVTRALLDGIGLVVHPGFDAAAVTSAAHAGATLVSLVPTALARIQPQAFRRILLGGSAVPTVVPPNAVATYGLTETMGGVVYDGVPLAGTEVRLAPDGEIQLKGPSLLRCYRDGRSPLLAGGWLPTGDIGSWDSLGRLHVDGRRDDLIITGGENVWPQLVERVLAEHTAVAEVAVTGEADREWGQRVVAWVVPAEPARPPTLEVLRAHVRRRLPAFMAPKVLRLLDRLPRTTSGKVATRSLRAPEP